MGRKGKKAQPKQSTSKIEPTEEEQHMRDVLVKEILEKGPTVPADEGEPALSPIFSLQSCKIYANRSHRTNVRTDEVVYSGMKTWLVVGQKKLLLQTHNSTMFGQEYDAWWLGKTSCSFLFEKKFQNSKFQNFRVCEEEVCEEKEKTAQKTKLQLGTREENSTHQTNCDRLGKLDCV